MFCYVYLSLQNMAQETPLIPQQALRSVAHLVFKCPVPVFED